MSILIKLIKSAIVYAKGKLCPYCKNPMYSQSEEEQPAGTWVVYVCRNGNCNHKEKVFEDK